MATYTVNSTVKFKDLFTSSSIETELKHTFNKESFAKIPSINISSSVEMVYGEKPMIELSLIDNYNLHLKFNHEVTYAKFELNDILISEMSVNNSEYVHEIYPYLLKQGTNILRIYMTDHNGLEHIKVFDIDKQLLAPAINIGDVLHIKGKRYTVSNTNSDMVTLAQPLEIDIDEKTFAELPSFSVVPYAQLGFYGESVVTVPMQFVKSIFKDGLVEDMYELTNILGDILHTKIDIVRGDVSKTISLSNIEHIIIPDSEE